MLCGNVVRTAQVCNRPGHLQNSIVRTRRQAHTTHRHLERPLAGFIKRTKSPQLAVRNMCVVETSRLLNRASRKDSFANLGRSHTFLVRSEFFIWNRGHLDVKIDSIQQRPADLAKISLNNGACATAFSRRVTIKPAWVRLQILVAFAQSGLCYQNRTCVLRLRH